MYTIDLVMGTQNSYIMSSFEEEVLFRHLSRVSQGVTHSEGSAVFNFTHLAMNLLPAHKIPSTCAP